MRNKRGNIRRKHHTVAVDVAGPVLLEYLYQGIEKGRELAQDMMSLGGKTLRVKITIGR